MLVDPAVFPLTAVAYDRGLALLIAASAEIASAAFKHGSTARWKELCPSEAERMLSSVIQDIRLLADMERNPEEWERRLHLEGEGDVPAPSEEHF